MYHTPALLTETIAGLAIKPNGVYVDATFGGGGHTKAILTVLTNEGRLVAFDQDADAAANLPEDERLLFVAANFRHLEKYLRVNGINQVNGILADLGVSSHQFDTPKRGFSIRFDEQPLDMRMDTNQPITAAHILNTYPEKQLANLFYQYGELPQANKIAHAIVQYRQTTAITRVGQLKTVTAAFPGPPKYQIGFYAQLFQALRIAVNDELSALCDLLQQSVNLLPSGGRLAIIAYHSAEDRLVKNFIKNGNFDIEPTKDIYGNKQLVFKPVNKKAITPNAAEIAQNNRVRSAKLRVAEKI